MTDNNKEYPEWQKDIRAAQAVRDESQRQKTEAAEKARQEQLAKRMEQDNANLKIVLSFLGFPEATPIDGKFQIGDYAFSDADYDEHDNSYCGGAARKSVSLTVGKSLASIEGLTAWYDENESELWRGAYKPDDPERYLGANGKNLDWTDAKAKLADVFDALDEEMEDIRQAWEENKAELVKRRERERAQDEADTAQEADDAVAPTTEQRLLAALKRYIDEIVAEPDF